MTIIKIKKKRLKSFIDKWSKGASYTEGSDCFVPLKGEEKSPTLLRYHIFKSHQNTLDCEVKFVGENSKQTEKMMQKLSFFADNVKD